MRAGEGGTTVDVEGGGAGGSHRQADMEPGVDHNCVANLILPVFRVRGVGERRSKRERERWGSSGFRSEGLC